MPETTAHKSQGKTWEEIIEHYNSSPVHWDELPQAVVIKSNGDRLTIYKDGAILRTNKSLIVESE